MKHPMWSKGGFIIALFFLLLATSPLFSPAMADEKKVTAPISQVVKTEKLSAEQLTKAEVTVPISWVSEEYLEEHGYTKEEQATDQSTNEKGWTLVWESDFEEGDLDGFRPAAVDLSVGCEEYKPSEEDVLAHAVKDETAPEGDYVLELVANPEHEGGTFVNAITARHVPFKDDSLYKLTGYFKSVGNYELEMLDAEFQLINEGGTEYVSSFIWYLNHFNKPQYERVMVPTEKNDEPPYLRILELKKDNEWHYFEIVGEYREEPKSRTVNTITIDNKEKKVYENMMVVDHIFSDMSQVLLETHNMYTNCNPENHFVGKSRWDEIKVYKKPIEKE